MEGEALISRFNEFNGGPTTTDALKKFHSQIEKYLDSVGTGPFVPKLKAIAERLTKAIKYLTDNKTVRIDKVEWLPLEIPADKVTVDINKIKRQIGELSKLVRKKPTVRTIVRKEVVKVKETPAQRKKIAVVINEFEKGKLKTSQGKKVKKISQATAIALREAGVPKKKQKRRSGLKGMGENRRLQTSETQGATLLKTVNPTAEPLPSNNLGFVTADQTPTEPGKMLTLPGVIGELLGLQQQYKLEIVIPGETHSSKSQLGMQVADAFASVLGDGAWLDWEQGGLQSKDTQANIARNVSAANRSKIHVSGEVPRTLNAVKALAKQFKWIALDSGTKLDQATNAWIDQLREEFPDTVWIILMQQNEKGGTRGGSSAEFDAPVVLKTYRPDESDYRKNYAKVYKNRGNKTGLFYSISEKKILTDDPEKDAVIADIKKKAEIKQAVKEQIKPAEPAAPQPIAA